MGNKRRIWYHFKVRWTNYSPSAQLVIRGCWKIHWDKNQDDCSENIRSWCEESGLNPAKEYYPDPGIVEGSATGLRCWMCGFSENHKALGLKTHIRRTGHNWNQKLQIVMVRKKVKTDKLTGLQETRPKVKWGDQPVQNSWRFKYLGNIFEADANQIPDIEWRITLTKAWAGQLRHILGGENLPLPLKLRLYISLLSSILIYGSEAWLITERVCRKINGVNAYMLSHITGRSIHEEATSISTTFDIITWIRSRRLKWVGHILRLNDEKLIKRTLKHIHDNKQEGDITMDTPNLEWKALQHYTTDRSRWRHHNVLNLKQMVRREIPEKRVMRCSASNVTTTAPTQTFFKYESKFSLKIPVRKHKKQKPAKKTNKHDKDTMQSSCTKQTSTQQKLNSLPTTSRAKQAQYQTVRTDTISRRTHQ